MAQLGVAFGLVQGVLAGADATVLENIKSFRIVTKLDGKSLVPKAKLQSCRFLSKPLSNHPLSLMAPQTLIVDYLKFFFFLSFLSFVVRLHEDREATLRIV